MGHKGKSVTRGALEPQTRRSFVERAGFMGSAAASVRWLAGCNDDSAVSWRTEASWVFATGNDHWALPVADSEETKKAGCRQTAGFLRSIDIEPDAGPGYRIRSDAARAGCRHADALR